MSDGENGVEQTQIGRGVRIHALPRPLMPDLSELVDDWGRRGDEIGDKNHYKGIGGLRDFTEIDWRRGAFLVYRRAPGHVAVVRMAASGRLLSETRAAQAYTSRQGQHDGQRDKNAGGRTEHEAKS